MALFLSYSDIPIRGLWSCSHGSLLVPEKLFCFIKILNPILVPRGRRVAKSIVAMIDGFDLLGTHVVEEWKQTCWPCLASEAKVYGGKCFVLILVLVSVEEFMLLRRRKPFF